MFIVVSYDLQIYSVRPFDPAIFNGVKNWNVAGSAFQTAKWQVVVNSSDKLLPEDVEDEIASQLPGIGFLTELNLEGVQADAAFRQLRAAAKKIAKAAHGVIVDPQEDTIQTPADVARFSPPVKEKSFSVLALSWWFLNDTLIDRGKRESLFTLLERQLPEAMPRRYGTYEPPEHIYAETGKAHLHEFLDKNLIPYVILYPNRPVATLSLSCPPAPGPSRQGYRSHFIEIGIESSVLQQPGWDQTLRRFWKAMSKLLRPLYAEVRTNHGYSRSGGTIYVAADNLHDDEYLNRNWFWRGIPKVLGHAVVLGTDYQKLWPQFVAKAEMEDGLAFASTADWSADADLTQIVGATPKDLAIHRFAKFGEKQEYPKIWPFGPTFN